MKSMIHLSIFVQRTKTNPLDYFIIVPFRHHLKHVFLRSRIRDKFLNVSRCLFGNFCFFTAVNNRYLFFGIYTLCDRTKIIIEIPCFILDRRFWKYVSRLSSEWCLDQKRGRRRKTFLKHEIPSSSLARDRKGPSNFTNPVDTLRHGGGRLPMCALRSIRYYYGLTAEIHAKRSNFV